MSLKTSALCILVLLLALTQPLSAQIFHINYKNSKLTNDDLALLNRMGKFESAFYNQVFGTTKNDSVTVEIDLYGRHGEYNTVQKKAMNTTFADGFYTPMENKIYLYKSDRYMRTLLHETSHNLLRYNYRNPPKWLNEGIASLLENLVETTDNEVLYIPQGPRIRQVRDSISIRHFNLNEYFNTPDYDWFNPAKNQMLYSTAYSIIFFLVNQDRDYLSQILVLMQHGYSTSDAFKKSFGSLDAFTQKFYYFYVHGGGKSL